MYLGIWLRWKVHAVAEQLIHRRANLASTEATIPAICSFVIKSSALDRLAFVICPNMPVYHPWIPSERTIRRSNTNVLRIDVNIPVCDAVSSLCARCCKILARIKGYMIKVAVAFEHTPTTKDSINPSFALRADTVR